MIKREWGAESNGKLPHLFITSKTATLVPELAVETCLWAELQPWCLNLQWKSCPWAEHSDDDDIIISHTYSKLFVASIYIICIISLFVVSVWAPSVCLHTLEQGFSSYGARTNKLLVRQRSDTGTRACWTNTQTSIKSHVSSIIMSFVDRLCGAVASMF